MTIAEFFINIAMMALSFLIIGLVLDVFIRFNEDEE